MEGAYNVKLSEMIKNFDEVTEELEKGLIEAEKEDAKEDEVPAEPAVAEDEVVKDAEEPKDSEEVAADPEPKEESEEDAEATEEVEEEEEEAEDDEKVEKSAEEVEKSAEPDEEDIEKSDKKESDKKDEEEEDEEDEDPKAKKKKKKKDPEAEDEEDDKEEKVEKSEDVNKEDFEGILKSILNSYKATVDTNKSLLGKIEALDEKIENLTKSFTVTEVEVSKSVGEDFQAIISEDAEAIEKGVSEVPETAGEGEVAINATEEPPTETTAEPEVEEAAVAAEPEVEEPIFDAEAHRQSFLDRFQQETSLEKRGKSTYNRAKLYDFQNLFLDARQGKQLSEADQQRLKDFTEGK